MAANVTEKKLTLQQRQAIAALLVYPTVSKAAAAVDIRRETLHRWQKQPDFAAALAEAEGEALQNFSRALLALSELAMQTLSDALQPRGVPLGYRLRAVQILIGNLGNVLDMVQFNERLTALENAQHDKPA